MSRYVIVRLVIVTSILAFVLQACASRDSTEPPPNVILVVVDTLRADHLGLHGYPVATTPNLDRREAEWLVFERAYATSSWTLPTIASLLTGTLPVTHAAGGRLEDRRWKRSRLADQVVPLAETLAENGWHTGAVVTSPWLRSRFGLERGFQDYDYGLERRATESVDLALDWFETCGQPCFLFLHMIDPHLPYAAPEPFRGRFSPGLDWEPTLEDVRKGLASLSPAKRAALIGRYDEEVAFVDAQLGVLMDRLEEQNFFESGLLILTSDHGEEFFEHGGFEHGHALHDEVVRVPLLARGAGVTPGRVAEPVSSIDIAPSILELAGVSAPPHYAGSPVFGRRAETPAAVVIDGVYYGSPKLGLVRWPYKLVRKQRGEPELFDLEADPGESTNLAEDRPDLALELAAELERVLGGAPAGERRHPGEATAETDNELRSLGYVN